MRLQNKVAIITGGSRGIGYATAEAFLREGAAVIITASTIASTQKAVARLKESYPEGIIDGISPDLTSLSAVQQAFDEVIAKYGAVDILVNNAVDRRNMTSLASATRQKLRDSAETNLNGQILLSQAVLEYMIPAGKGSIINISSMRGLDCPHFPFYPESMGDQPVNYTTEKWAMVGLTKYMAGRYGKHGIRVNCIAPGGFNPGLADDPDKKAFVDTYIANCPLGCWAGEDDIKGPVAFLAADASAYVTGATLVMDGGWTIW